MPDSPEIQTDTGEFVMSQKNLNLPAQGFIRLAIILSLIPISKSAWWEGCRAGRFPQPVKLGPRTTAWRVEDIRDLIDRLGKGEVEF